MSGGPSETPRDAALTPPHEVPNTNHNTADLHDAELQEKYRKEYLIQLKRLSCPGCGEEPFA